MSSGYAAALWAMEHHLRRTNPAVAEQVRTVRQEIGREFGLLSRVIAGVLGPYLLWTARREARRLAQGADLRAPDHHRAPQLDAAGSLGLRRSRAGTDDRLGHLWRFVKS